MITNNTQELITLMGMDPCETSHPLESYNMVFLDLRDEKDIHLDNIMNCDEQPLKYSFL